MRLNRPPSVAPRCKLIDLGKWFNEEQRISSPLAPEHFEELPDTEEFGSDRWNRPCLPPSFLPFAELYRPEPVAGDVSLVDKDIPQIIDAPQLIHTDQGVDVIIHLNIDK